MSLKAVVRVSLLVVALLGLAGQVPGPAPAAASPQAPSPSAPLSPAPAATPAGKDPLLEFVPKEHVPADSAVSFPVDI
ncbi:MAG TPA: hypothetical protein VFE68_06370 [Vicinamibacteria bacterium]|nr:hypothetical protein [Vicinamibacteria bacterium]